MRFRASSKTRNWLSAAHGNGKDDTKNGKVLHMFSLHTKLFSVSGDPLYMYIYLFVCLSICLFVYAVCWSWVQGLWNVFLSLFPPVLLMGVALVAPRCAKVVIWCSKTCPNVSSYGRGLQNKETTWQGRTLPLCANTWNWLQKGSRSGTVRPIICSQINYHPGTVTGCLVCVRFFGFSGNVLGSLGS